MTKEKESGLTKLIELLNEYEEKYRDFHFVGDWNEGREFTEFEVAFIISKQFGFIKWLVENEKIDTDIVYREGFLAKTYDKDEVGEYFEPYEEILMLLAIQENPIEFLVSILK